MARQIKRADVSGSCRAGTCISLCVSPARSFGLANGRRTSTVNVSATQRTAVLRDPFGHRWNIGQHIEDVSPDEMQRRYDEMTEKS